MVKEDDLKAEVEKLMYLENGDLLSGRLKSLV